MHSYHRLSYSLPSKGSSRIIHGGGGGAPAKFLFNGCGVWQSLFVVL